MKLAWRDAVGTLLVSGAAVLTYAVVNDFDWPLLSSVRISTLLLVLLGFASCIVIGSGESPAKNNWTIAATAIGILAMIIALFGIIFGSQWAFLSLFACILGLWILTSFHHLYIKPMHTKYFALRKE